MQDMIEKIVQALESEGFLVHVRPQEKVPRGEVVVTLESCPVSAVELRAYQVDWTYSVSTVLAEVEEIEQWMVKTLRALETVETPELFKVEDTRVVLEGGFYVVSMKFVVSEMVDVS